jgi:hypothetical protein
MRRTTPAVGGKVPNELPLTAGKGNQFSVVVEGTAGRVLGASGQPYMLEIVALDITAGANPHSEANHFTQRRLERFDAAHGWPDKVSLFTVTLNELAAVEGPPAALLCHVDQCESDHLLRGEPAISTVQGRSWGWCPNRPLEGYK